MRKMTSRAIAVAMAGAMALTCSLIEPVAAASAQTPVAKETPASGMTDVSASRRHYRHGGDRAAIGAMLGIAGTIAGIAAANSYRRHYYDYDRSYYGYAPAPYYGGYYNYAGPRFYGHHHWHR
jgi:hypothetical protein